MVHVAVGRVVLREGGWDLVCWAGNCEGVGVQPLQEPLEDLWFFFGEADGLIKAFGEGTVEGCGEKGTGCCQEFFVDEVGESWTSGVLLVADDDGGHRAEGAESRAKRNFGWSAAWAWARNGRWRRSAVVR